MPRDKEKKRRDDSNNRVIAALYRAFACAQFYEVKTIPRLSAIVVCDSFKGISPCERQEYLRTQIGDELYNNSYVRMYTTFEYAEKLEERANPMD